MGKNKLNSNKKLPPVLPKTRVSGDEYSNNLENGDNKQEVSGLGVHEVREYANTQQVFARANSSKQKSKYEKVVQDIPLKGNSDSSEIMENLVSQLSKLSKEYTDIVNSAISKNLTVVNSRIRVTEDIFSQLLSSMSKGMQENVVLTKDLLKCNGLLDLALLQRKMFEMYCTNMVNSSIEVARNIRKFE